MARLEQLILQVDRESQEGEPSEDDKCRLEVLHIGRAEERSCPHCEGAEADQASGKRKGPDKGPKETADTLNHW